jgi:predicted sulfurtransferase
MTDPKDSNDSNDSKKDQKDYEIGRGKPPKATQFKKGQSGNAKGRPIGSQNFVTILNNALNASVQVTKKGKQQNVKKKVLIATQLINQAASGNLKAIGMVLSEDKQLQGSIASIAPVLTLKPTDEIIQKNIMVRMEESIRAKIALEQINQAKEIDTSTGEAS